MFLFMFVPMFPQYLLVWFEFRLNDDFFFFLKVISIVDFHITRIILTFRIRIFGYNLYCFLCDQL